MCTEFRANRRRFTQRITSIVETTVTMHILRIRRLNSSFFRKKNQPLKLSSDESLSFYKHSILRYSSNVFLRSASITKKLFSLIDINQTSPR
uniref:AlNc14C111G6402 protein n=1 Tax=Albugo laibachii Nc14 TaxID=890382 RepID=F0WIK2_9STRA|nr:AlNc14C111G6402 [Albugo laibachii Nc14]|eukprot:CCA21086.1 AlNc14C111G6402 [Albugo laibachii Nc14]